jgi:hypothetical protein
MAASLFTNSLSASALEPYDGYTDLPIPIYYRELYRLCPDALFILTQRDEDSWIRSIKIFLEPRSHSGSHSVRRDMMRLALFGTITFNEERFRRIFRLHNAGVREFFDKSPSSLLCLDVTDNEAWETLTKFLKAEKPKVSFPKISNPAIGTLNAVGRENIELVRRQLQSFREN